MPPVQSLSRQRLAEFAGVPAWYHTIDLGAGITTNGTYDHRPFLEEYGFPDDLSGATVLDVGASDGFFSFTLAARNATRVLAIDTNTYDGAVPTEVSATTRRAYEEKYAQQAARGSKCADVYKALGVPIGHQFLAARALLGSPAQYKNHSAYDLADLGHQFDLVFCGDLVEHLKHPLLALENLVLATRGLCVVALSSVLRDPRTRIGQRARGIGFRAMRAVLGAELPEMERAVRYVGNDSGGSFFQFAPETFRRALLASGFRDVRIHSTFEMRNKRNNIDNPHVVYHCRP